MKIVSVILARGGSKEIPKKNIIDLNGKPLIEYVIDASRHSIVGDETYVSSDCEEILRVADELGVYTIKRKEGISGDFDKSELALLDFISKVESDILVFLQPTSPFLTSNHINEGVEMLLTKPSLNSILSVYEEHWVPRWGKNKKPIGWDIHERPMRQEVEKIYIENGAFYITRTHKIRDTKLRYAEPFDYVIMKSEESLQVDSLDDLKLISKLLKLRNVK